GGGIHHCRRGGGSWRTVEDAQLPERLAGMDLAQDRLVSLARIHGDPYDPRLDHVQVVAQVPFLEDQVLRRVALLRHLGRERDELLASHPREEAAVAEVRRGKLEARVTQHENAPPGRTPPRAPRSFHRRQMGWR